MADPSGQDVSLLSNNKFPNPYSIYPEDPLGSTLLSTLPTTGWYQAGFSPDFFNPPVIMTTTTSTTTQDTPRFPFGISSSSGGALYVQWTTRPPLLTTDNIQPSDTPPNGEGTFDGSMSSDVSNTENDPVYDELTTTDLSLTSRMSSEVLSAPGSSFVGAYPTASFQGPVHILSFSAAGPNLIANVLGVPVNIPLGHLDPETLNTPLQNVQGGGATAAKILQALAQMYVHYSTKIFCENQSHKHNCVAMIGGALLDNWQLVEQYHKTPHELNED